MGNKTDINASIDKQNGIKIMSSNITPLNANKWIKLWAKMQMFLHVLTTAHPITKKFIDEIDDKIKQKYLSAEEKYKTVFNTLASTSNQEIRNAISLTTNTLQKQPRHNKITTGHMLLSGFNAHRNSMGKLPKAINNVIPADNTIKAPLLS